MKKYLMVLAVLFMTSVAYAKESGYSLSTALVGMSMDYVEYDDNDMFLDSEKSGFSGIKGVDLGIAYVGASKDNSYAEYGVSLTALSGETDYVGSYLISGEPAFSTTQNSILDMEIEYKLTHTIKDKLEFSYGIGLGYRSWRRGLSASQIEIYNWGSIRPKVGAVYNISMFSAGVNLEYQYGINPKMTLLANSENSDTTVNLGAANTIQFSIPLKVRLHKRVDLFFEYIYEHQSIEKSDTAPYIINGVQYTIWEPASTANNLYAKFGMVFKF